MANKLEIDIMANTQGAITNLKATYANINRVADIMAKLEEKGDMSALQTAYAEFNQLVERNAEAMVKSGKEMDIAKAKAKALEEALNSMAQTKAGQNGALKDTLASLMSDEMSKVAPTIEKTKKAIDTLGPSFQKATKEIEKQKSGLEKYLSKLGDTIKNIVQFRIVMKLSNGVSRLFVNTIKDSIQAAAEQEQVFSKLTTVFGKYSDAQKNASDLSEKLGISATSAANALSTVGDLLQAQGASTSDSLQLATEWVEKFSDIIAFKDIDMSLEEFAQNFMSGASGNLRNFRTFGSIVKESAVNARLASQGLDKLTGSELELAKMTTRAEIALEQQKNAFGATAREWDTMLSVQRRYESAQKQFEENVGNWIEPVTKGWTLLKTEIMDLINQYDEAYDRYKNGDFSENENASVNNPNKFISEENQRNVYDMLFAPDSQSMAISDENLIHYLRTVGATMQNLTYIYEKFNKELEDGEEPQTAMYERLQKLARANDTNVLNEKNVKEVTVGIQSMAEAYDKFLESLQSIDGVNYVGSHWYDVLSAGLTKAENGGISSEKLAERLACQIYEATNIAFEEAKSDIASISASYMGSLFGDENEGSLAQRRADAYKNLFQVMESSGKYTEEQLLEIKSLWDDEISKVEKYNEEQERATKLANLLKTISSGGNVIGTDYANQLKEAKFVSAWETTNLPGDYNNFFSEEHAKAYYLWQQKLNDALSFTVNGSTEYQTILSNANNELKQMYAYYKYIAEESEKLAKNAQLMETANKRNETVKGYIDSTKDYYSQLEVLGMSDADATLYNLQKASDKAWESGDSQLGKAIDANIKAFEELTKATNDLTEAEEAAQALQDQKDTFLNPLKASWDAIAGIGGSVWGSMKGAWEGMSDAPWWNKVGGAVKGAFSGGADSMLGGVGGLWGFLSEIATQTKAFQKLSSIVSDYIVPVLDSFIEPLLPIIELIGKFLQNTLMSFLDWFYPIFNTVCAAVALIVGYVEGISRFVEEGIKWAIGSLVEGVVGGIGKLFKKDWTPDWAKEWADIKPWDDMLSAFEEANKTAKAILGNTFQIEENTSSNSYGTYAQLLKDKYITSDQYATLIGGNKYSSSNTMGSATMTLGGNGNATYITINGLTLDTDITDGEGVLRYIADNARGVVAY